MPERECSKCTANDKRRWGCFAKQYVRVDQRTGEPILQKDGKPELFWHERARMPVQIDGENEYACPRQHIRENHDLWHMMLLYYGLYSKGHLPDEGSVSRQSHFAVSLFALMDQYNRDCDEVLDERRRRNAEANRNNNGAGAGGLTWQTMN